MTKFKPKISTKRLSLRHTGTNNHCEPLVLRTGTTIQRGFTSTDCATEVTYCASKIEDLPLGINDEITQTDSLFDKNSLMSNTTKYIEQHRPERLLSALDNEHMDFPSILPPKSIINHTQTTSVDNNSSNTFISNENPWKKQSHVRYKSDEKNVKENNTSSYPDVYAQHITFV